jgi:hypothetical protein
MKTSSISITNITAYQSRISASLLWLTLLLFTGCAPIEVKFDYNKDTNFDKLRSYAWIKNEQPDIVEIPVQKDVLDRLVMDAADKVLNDNGYFRNDNPDFLITYYLVINTKTDVYMIENYYSDIGYATPAVTSSTRDHEKIRRTTYEQGILILDVLDNQSKERIWRGYAQSRIGVYEEPEKQGKRVTTAIKKILDKFPP